MSAKATIVLEVLSGPLDGRIIELDRDMEWSKEGAGLLAFPWDAGLGSPQARVLREGGEWRLHCFASDHGTYRPLLGERITDGSFVLVEGEVLKASHTWLRVRNL